MRKGPEGPFRGPRRTIDDAEFATLEWVDWFNHRRLIEPFECLPPAEYEEMFYRQQSLAEPEGPVESHIVVYRSPEKRPLEDRPPDVLESSCSGKNETTREVPRWPTSTG